MIIFYFFAAVLVFLSYKSLRGGIHYLNFYKKELSETKPEYAPFVSVIAPCRGIDADLEENLSSLFRQNFPAYEILFVVDDERDEAVKIIRKIFRKGAKGAKLIVAGKAIDSSQKVHNLREAVLKTDEKSEIFVFVDSDEIGRAHV